MMSNKFISQFINCVPFKYVYCEISDALASLGVTKIHYDK